MAKDIQMNSQEWSDMVFEKRNKAYGAYQMRLDSSKRHVWAIILVLIAAALIAVVPMIYSTVRKAFIERDGLSDTLALANLQDKDDTKPDDEFIKPEAPPPPPLKTTIQFVPPKMVDASEITDENLQKTTEEVEKADVQVGAFDVKGTDDLNAITKEELDAQQVIVEPPKKEEVFYAVEQMPEFPGGISELYKWVNDHIRYPTIAQENGVQEKISVRFVVEKDGSVSDVQALRGVDESLKNEAVRVVQSLPKFQPGRQNGRAVRVYYSIPINFKLQTQ
ncbi:MAG: energy transducer TonB [Paludibacter sp.]|nr:energy transducer TonB [Paludibacter sp.]